MKNGKDKPPSRIHHRKIILLFLFSVALTFIINVQLPSPVTDYASYQPGDVAGQNIKSPQDISIPELNITLKKGEIIVREGERITDAQLNELSAIKNLYRKDTPFAKKAIIVFFILFLSITTIFEFADKFIKKFNLREKDLIFCITLTIFTTILAKLSLLVFGFFAKNYIAELFYLVPIFFFGIILRIVLYAEAAIILSLILGIVMGFAFHGNMPILMYVILGNILAAHLSGRCERRNKILQAGLYTSLMISFIMILFDLFLGNPISNAPLKIVFIILNGIGSSFIALGLLPVIEYVFNYTTDIKLLELANFENPLLEEMMVDAPGSYHHSIVVGNLAKAAAESIGAHPLLARVSAYYHDIGKLKMPHYFIENRKGNEDPHHDLSPNMSALIILSHVKEGIELADKYKLGNRIKEIIQQHHGTSLVTYFYNKAKEQEDPKLHVTEEKDFRYAGPKPQTKEAGIVMLADAVEASSRILEEPTPKRIENHVQNVIENIFLDGQLDECELTLKDLHAIQKSFIGILIGIFHHRIEYPERTTQNGTHKKLPKAPEDKNGSDKKNSRGLAHLFRAAG